MIVNGWTLYAHPLMLAQLATLTATVERIQKKDRQGYARNANTKVLAALHMLMFEVVPADPARPEFRQGSTLGSNRNHWFRAKFGGGPFRLFFRYASGAKIIIYAWVNDANTLRTYGSKSDAYAVFQSMLDKGNPPDDWMALAKQSDAINKPAHFLFSSSAQSGQAIRMRRCGYKVMSRLARFDGIDPPTT
jgi:toxin YhaV